jgi:hypothetical protein
MTGTRLRGEAAAPQARRVHGFGAELMCRRHVSGDHKPPNLAKSVTVE